MTLKQIEYFQTVCEKGNISAAADALFISRSVISRALAELENEFDTQLLVRSKSGVTLTMGGQILARLFEEYKTAYDTTKKRFQALHESLQGTTLKLGITPTNAFQIHQQYIIGFHSLYPELRMVVNEYSASQANELLADGTIDAFFTPARFGDCNMLESLALYKTQIALGTPSGTALAQKRSLGISDILDIPFCCLNAPMPLEDILNSCFAAFGKVPNIITRTSDLLLLRELVLHGCAHCILPDNMFSMWEGVTAVPLNFFPISTHRLVWNKALPHNKAFQLFLKHIKSIVPDCLD